MCGIVGWVNLKENLTTKSNIIEKMKNTLSERGPDDSGTCIYDNAILGHRRLVVVDPKGGAQPMVREKAGKSYTIIYNGELYNTKELRDKLIKRGYKFKSYSDTEVLLISYIEFGFDCVDYLNGIFAFGIWDESKQTIFLARDRLGVKPLFYTQKGNDFIFGSEIKALLVHPDIDAVINDESVMEIFGLGPARSPGCGIYKGIFEVEPGFCLKFDKNGIKKWPYWQLKSQQHLDDLDATVEKVRSILFDAIKRQLISDVPVCTLLSGGIDSSTISAVTAKTFREEGKGKLKTFSIDYEDNKKYFRVNEFQPDSDAFWIKKVVSHIDSEHHDIIIDTPSLAKALRDAVLANDLPGMADIDSSLYLFCKEIKRYATVALSGECADEIFGGYPWFRRQEDIYATTFPWSKSIKERQSILSDDFLKLPLEDYVQSKYNKTLKEVPLTSYESTYEKKMKQLFYLNMKWFMQTLLTRKDRMSMANSLEVRVPFADHRLVEYMWNVPIEMKFCDNIEKGLLRRAVKDILPEGIINRRKSPYPKTHNPTYQKVVQQKMKRILEKPSSPILPFINIEKVTQIVETGGKSFDKPWFGQLMTGPQLIAYLIQVNIWLEEYNVKYR